MALYFSSRSLDPIDSIGQLLSITVGRNVPAGGITRIKLIIYIEDPKEAFSINHAHIKDTKVKKTTIVNIVTTSYPVRSNIISIINLNASQISIQ